MLKHVEDRSRPKALLVCGSTSSVSRTRVLLSALDRELSTTMTVEFWDLALRPLSMADPAFHHEPLATPDMEAREFILAVRNADAIALASPLYHGSYSGVMKNALDHLGFDAFRHKPVALLSHGASATRCAQPVEHLQSVVRTLYGQNLQTQICTSNKDFGELNGKIVVTSNDIMTRLERLREEIARSIQMQWMAPGR